MFDVGSAVGYLLLDTSKWESGLKSARAGLRTFEDQTATAADKFTAAGVALGSVGKTLTVGVTAPLVGLGAAAVSVGNEFEAQMSRVKSISGATGEEFEALNDLALKLGAETAFSASEAAQGMENLASAGFTTQEIMDSLPGVLDLAASSGTDLATATEIAASAVRGFGLEADQAGHVADVFAEAAARTNAQTEDMGEAMKYIAPVAAAMGQSLEETAAAIGIMSDAGIKGSQAGTALRGAFSRLAKPTEKMYEVMDDLGLSFYDTAGNMLPLNGIIEQLETNMGGLTQEQRNQALVTLFGQESLSGMLALMERGSGELLELTKSFEEVEGSAAAMAEVMLDNTSGAIEEMFGSLETLGIKVQQVLAPVITDVIQGLTSVINWVSSLDDGALKLLVTIAGIVAAIGPLLVIVGKFSTSIGGLMAMVTKAGGMGAVLSQAFTALTGPVGIAIAAIVAFAAAWATNFGGIRDVTANVMSSIGTIISSVLGVIKDFWENDLLGIRTIVENGMKYIETVFGDALAIIEDLFNVFSDLFSGDWESLWQNIKQLVSDVWQAIKDIVGGALDLLVTAVLGWAIDFAGAFIDVFESVKNAISEKWEEIKAWFEGIKNDPVSAILSIGDALFEAGASIITSLWNGIKSIWTDVAKWFQEKVEWVKDKVTFWENEGSKMSASPVAERGSGFGGSYASGLDYVPRDMNVKVHEGEGILTKEQNRDRNLGEARSFPETLNFNLSIPMDGDVVARKQYSYNVREGTLRGDSFIEEG